VYQRDLSTFLYKIDDKMSVKLTYKVTDCQFKEVGGPCPINL